MAPKVLGTFRGRTVKWDGELIAVATEYGSGWTYMSRDWELNGNFRRWLERRGVVLP